MRTEDLILRLAEDTVPAPSVRRGVLRALGLALLAALALVLLGWGLRPGLGQALANPFVAVKVALPALASVAAVAGSLALARPDGRAARAVAALAGVALACLGLLALSLIETPPEGWGAALRGQTRAACLLSIPAVAILPTSALIATLHRGASTRPALSGALAGLGGGAAAAALYALHCPEDDPLFYVTWYGTGVLLVGALGALAGRRWLRW